MNVIAFFNNNDGKDRTALVYHLAWMFSEIGMNVLVADLDPQSNLTGMFLEQDRLEELWPPGKHPLTIQAAVDSIVRGSDDIQTPHVEPINDRMGLIAGDFGLAGLEERLAEAWASCRAGDKSAFLIVTAFYRAVLNAAEKQNADVVLIDIGPNLGAISRSALTASQHVIVPLTSDLSSLQGLRMLGPQLRAWRNSWKKLGGQNADAGLRLPLGNMNPMGYVATGRRGINRIPAEYAASVLSEGLPKPMHVEDDPHCLARMTDYRSLMPMAIAARKPMFLLKPADGAMGGHAEAARDCYREFQVLVKNIRQCLDELQEPQSMFQ